MRALPIAFLVLALPLSANGAVLALDAQRYTVGGVRNVRAATAVVVFAGPAGDASLSLTRLDDSVDGTGWAVGAGAARRLAAGTLVRGGFVRVARTSGLDAWSARLGPEFHTGAATLALAALGGRREDGAWTRGGALELERSLSPRVAARLTASLAHTDGEPDALAGAAGARWNLAGPLYVTGELGLARDPAGALATGGGIFSAPTVTDALRPSARLGARLILP